MAPAIALTAFIVLAIVVATTATNPGSTTNGASAIPSEPTPSPAAVPLVVSPPPAETRTRRIANRRLTLTVPNGWTLTKRPRGLTATGPNGTQVRITTGPRRGRSRRRLGADARRALARRSRAPLRRIRIGGRRAGAVTAAGRQIVQIPDGRRRWLISRPADGGARVVRSLRIRAV